MKYTDNVRFNIKFSVIYLIATAYYLYTNTELWIIVSISSSFLFIFSSAFFQPDLDLSSKRPGMSTFPLGSFKSHPIGEKLFLLLYPLNRLWFYIWKPYGLAFTHRGVSHLPIIGTYTRVIYLYSILYVIDFIFKSNINIFEIFFTKAFFSKHTSHIQWVAFCLPIFISDIIHFLVDLYDSIKSGKRFTSYAHQPGLIYKMFNPKMMKYHKKALKSAKRNKKKKS